MAKVKKLTKGEKDGIRLLADLLVVEDLIKNVFEKENISKKHIGELRAVLSDKCPRIYLADIELKKQIKEVREIWLKETEAWAREASVGQQSSAN